MSRPLTCDYCNSIIDSVVPPLKVAVNGPTPPELDGMPQSEIELVLQIAKQMGATAPIQQTLLDFCSTLCLAQWGWHQAVGVPVREDELFDLTYKEGLEESTRG